MVKISMYTSGELAWENSGDGYQVYYYIKHGTCLILYILERCPFLEVKAKRDLSFPDCKCEIRYYIFQL